MKRLLSILILLLLVQPASAAWIFNPYTGKLDYYESGGGLTPHDHDGIDASGVLTNDAHDGYIDIKEIVEPGAPGLDTLRLYTTPRLGRTILRYKTQYGTTFQLGQDQVMVVRNETGVTIPAFYVVYESGTGAGGEPLVALARADSDTTMPALGMALESIPTGFNGFVMLSGIWQGLPTSGYSAGDILYISQTTAGILTATEPPHPNLKQRIARVLASHATDGVIRVMSREERGNHEGTNRNAWKIGDALAGAKSLQFVAAGANIGTLQMTPTAARTVTVPDTTGTLALTSQLAQTDSGAANNFFTAYNAGTGLFSKAQPSFSNISGTAAISQGGTNATATPTAGAVPYGTGTAYAFSAAGSSGECLKSGGTGSPTWGSCAAGGGYATIQDETTPLTQRTTVNFAGAGVTCVDNAGSTRTDCTIPGGGSSPTEEATYTMFGTGATVVPAGVLSMDLFNASGSGVVLRVLEVFAWQRDTAAVVGVRVPVEVSRTSAVGTGGTAITAGEYDSADPNLPDQVTARNAPTGGATAVPGYLGGGRVSTEEVSIGTATTGLAPWFQSQSPIYVNDGLTTRKRLVLREGEGLRCDVGTNVSGTGIVACGITFQTGSVGPNELPTYWWQANSAATANKKLIEVFNASGSGKTFTITRVVAYARPTAAVAGTVMTLEAYRTSSVGTGGTTITGRLMDTTDPAIPAQVTARDGPTGGAALSGGALIAETIGTDETGDSEYRPSFRRSGGVGHNVQYTYDGQSTRRPIVIREGEGFVIQTGPLSGVGNVVTIVEGTLN